MLFPLIFYIHRWRLKRKVERGHIRWVQGEVVRIGKKVIAHSEGRRLKMVNPAYPLPPEGDYLFFVLGNTNYLLSAQSMDSPESSMVGLQAGEKLRAELSRANHFTFGELISNREGHLSEQQRNRLIIASIKMFAGALLSFAILGLGIYLLAIVQLIQSTGVAWLVGIIAGLILFAIGAGLCAMGCLLALDVHDGRALMLEGPVKRAISMSNDSSAGTYYYAYEKFHQRVSKEAYRVLIPGLRYRLYYTPRAGRLLSLEPVDDSS